MSSNGPTEYHPNAHREPVIEHFSVFGQVEADKMRPHVDDEAPWTPFRSRADFEFAEIAHQATLNQDQTDWLLMLVWRIVDGNTNFTLKSHANLSKAWDLAASQMTPFEKHIIPVQHKKETLEFEMHTRPLWDWVLDLLNEPLLAPYFSSLPSNGAPFAIILYTDKTHLSSSGAVKGYPVIARCANLPVDIRNRDGWLPIVPEDSGEDGKLTYTNLKRVIWHESFFKLLESIIIYVKTGFAHECHDHITRWLYPLILLLSADYEEQCVMTLIRGTNCNCPCPVCLVPSTKLYDHVTTYPLRTAEEAQAHVQLYFDDRVAGEEALKEHGLRPVKNVFWKVPNSDPHEIISQDSLHLWHMGLFGRHKFDDLKKRVGNLGHEALKKVNDQFDAFPQWRNLNHFSRVTNVTFSDRNKFQDISKQILYASHNASYALLRCIASYLKLDMYISLDVHTADTIAAGEAELLVYQKLLEEYLVLQGDERMKNWNFPKVHGGKHIFCDVLEKGASRNFSTHPNEKQHGPIKRAYLRQTNRKDVANQLLKLNHISLVSEFIRSRIIHLDEERLRRIASESKLEDDEDETKDDQVFAGHIHLGSPQSLTSFALVEEAYRSNRAFAHFRKKVTVFLNNFLPSNNIPLPNGSTWLRPAAEDTLQEYCYLKVNYESFVDWKTATDYLRCNPSFYGCEKRDCALIRTHDKDGNDQNIFVRLLFMFKYVVDWDLCFTHLRARPAALSEFISIHSIIRGALLVPDYDSDTDFFVVDYMDTDMFLRSRRKFF
ncbi:hypothetical protein F4604DRAFT_1877352 [Suillus subluteus]|nr:hypothetical protein F4604DRAFT_1877352 [Suillus subluteus]